MVAVIRRLERADIEAVRALEIAAGQRFREVGLPEIADHDPPAPHSLAQAAGAGRAWVACDADGRVCGYLLVAPLGDALHVHQVSVHPDHQRRGLGRALLDHAVGLARAAGLRALTLTTFVDVPWNAPLYRRLGFHDLSPDRLPAWLEELRRQEATAGLDPGVRVCMRRDLDGPG
jgi:GNAT superfamily N-acetyltransferase